MVFVPTTDMLLVVALQRAKKAEKELQVLKDMLSSNPLYPSEAACWAETLLHDAKIYESSDGVKHALLAAYKRGQGK
jgi:hypothetical protein